jgi:corrinoid protein of di/trimethylamine methyltransferase
MGEPDYPAMERAVVEGDVEAARTLAAAAIARGDDMLAVVERGFAAGIRRVGDLWEEGEYFLPELVQGAEAMKAAMAVLQPALTASQAGSGSKGTVVIGTVQGDLHDIGKSLVATLLQAHGFEVHDLGSDVPVASFMAKARESGAQLIAASALLTTTMTVQRDLVQAVAREGLSGRVRVLVGGAPASPEWAAEIGASYAENALRAVAVVESLLR